MSLFDRWSISLDELRKQDRFRSFHQALGVDFTSNDYLGYASGRNVPGFETEQPGNRSLPRSGMASRLLRGHHAIWEEVEQQLAEWHGADTALMMTSGYTANEGLLSTILEPGDWVAYDELCHACILDGLRLARPRRFAYRHNDMNHLEEGLKTEAAKSESGRERFIITESLFSMDGDRAPLKIIVELANRYGAHVIVDEAHSTGCYGAHGAGCIEEEGVREQILASVHTGGKALAVPGAYIVGSQLLKDYLINKCRHLIFTTAIPAACGEWWLTMLPRVKADASGRSILCTLAQSFRDLLSRNQIPSAGTEFIVPIILGDNARTMRVARYLQEHGIDIRGIRPPSVPPETSRLRVSLHANHTPQQVNELAHLIRSAIQLG